MSIIERGRSSVSSLSLGKEGVQWLRKGMADISSQPLDHSFVRTCREEGRVLILQKNRNDRGRYVSVMEYGVKRRQGSIAIQEGHDKWGWRGFSLAINGLLGYTKPATTQPGTLQGLSRPPSPRNDDCSTKLGKAPIPQQSSLSFKGVVTNGNKIPVKSVSDNHQGDVTKISKEVNTRGSIAQIVLQLNLVYGPTGEWEVHQAQIMNSSTGAQANTAKQNPSHPKQTAPPQKVVDPVRPKHTHKEAHKAPTQVWRARSLKSGNSSREPSPSPTIAPEASPVDEKETTELACALTSNTLRRLGSETSTEVQIAGDATKWLLRLRDGRSIVLPAACLCGSGIAQDSGEMGQALVATDGGVSPKSSEGWCDDESMVDSMVEALETTGEVYGFSNPEQEAQSPICVEPIAISYPPEMENKPENEESIPTQQEPSDCVSEKYQEFGEYLGASYEGYESEVMGLLRAIESGFKKKDRALVTPKAPSKPSRGARELKNLVSSINYEGGSSKRHTINSGGTLLLTCQ